MGVGGKHREREEECFKQCIEELLLEVLYVLNIFFTRIYSYHCTLFQWPPVTIYPLRFSILSFRANQELMMRIMQEGGGVKGRPMGVQSRVCWWLEGRNGKIFFFEALSFSSVYFPGGLRKKHHGKFFPHLAMPTRHKNLYCFFNLPCTIANGNIFYA